MHIHDHSFSHHYATRVQKPHSNPIERLAFVKNGTKKEVYRRVSIAIEHIESNFRSGFDLGRLARMSCMSKYYLIRHFKTIVGFTPNEFHIRLRVANARLLLLSGSHTVTEVAIACGYPDLQAFSKQFKKMTGMTPSQFVAGKKQAMASAFSSEGDAHFKLPVPAFTFKDQVS